MKPAKNFSIVLVTAPDIRTARRQAKAALKANLVACVNLVPRIESHYWWQGRLEHGSEVLMILKTTRANLPKLEQLILELHPYDTAEFIVLPVQQGSERYLKWWAVSCQRG